MPDEQSSQSVPRDYLADWLGIPPEHRPASMYALCGVPDMTDDLDRIAEAARANIRKLRPFASHPVHGPAACRLLDTVSKAMTLLTDAEKKKKYDARLRSRKLHAITVLGKKLLEGDRERLAEFIDGAYAAAGSFPLREIEAAIVETYHKYRGQKFTFSRLGGYLRSPAWHGQAHLLTRLDQQMHQQQDAGQRFRGQRRETMAEGLRLGLSPAQSLAVWANRVQYEITLDRTLRSWGLGPDGQPSESAKAPGIGLWPWVTVVNTCIAAVLLIVTLIVHHSARSAAGANNPVVRPAPPPPEVRTWVHGPRLLRGQRFGALAARFDAEPAAARKAGYCRMLFFAAGGDEEVIATANGLIAREVDPAVRATALLAMAGGLTEAEADRLARALLPLAWDTRIGDTAARWMYERVFGHALPAGRTIEQLREDLFRRLDREPQPPNVVDTSAAGFERFWRRMLERPASLPADVAAIVERAGPPPTAGELASTAAVVDGLLRAPVLADEAMLPTQRPDLYLYRLGAVSRQWMLDDLKRTAGFDVKKAIERVMQTWFIDEPTLDPHEYRAIAAAQYVGMFDKTTAGRVIHVLRSVAGEPPPPAGGVLFHSAVEYLQAASGIDEPFDFAVPLQRSSANVKFSRWYEAKFGSPP